MASPEFAVRHAGKTYDIQKFVRDHPGGVNTLNKFRGKPITQVMRLYGHSNSAYHMLNDFKVESDKDGNLTGGVSANGRIITNHEADMDDDEIAFLEELEVQLRRLRAEFVVECFQSCFQISTFVLEIFITNICRLFRWLPK